MTPDGTLDLFADAPGADEPRTWTVTELNALLRSLLERSFGDLWVAGEVANWTRARSGHCYFTLKDERAQVRCVMWRSDAARLPVDPEEGMTLRVRGRVTLYEARGHLQVQVREVTADGGEGLWKLAFERLRQRLQDEGLLDAERKRPIPRFPRAVGVVTSVTGAALRDVLSVIRRRAPWTRVLVANTRVQGEGAAQEIARAIQALGGSGRVELLLVGRGGGSIEDLWAFNEEAVARAVVACPVPVISAVGHETDVTISDLVADLRAPTPSAGAEAAVQDRAAVLELLDAVRPRLARGLRAHLERRRRRFDEAGRRAHAAVSRIIEPRRTRNDDARRRLPRAMRAVIEARRRRLAAAGGQVEALSPLSTLRRGYAVPLDAAGKVLRTARDFTVDERFRLRVVDGNIDCEVREIRADGAAT